MHKFSIALLCCCLVGCSSNTNSTPTNFKERQQQLFYGIDHKQVYESCQELMCLYREGELSDNTFFCDDSMTNQKELPESIRLLHPTYVWVLGDMVTIGFFNEDGMQSLMCFSNEFGQSESQYGNAKGRGIKSAPFAMEKLSGDESLDYLNTQFTYWEMELVPGLSYQTSDEEQPTSLAEVKRSVNQMDIFWKMSEKMIEELAVKKQKLLYQTDHHVLLTACRQAISRYNDGQFSNDKIDISDERFVKDLKHIPKIILNLEPVYVWFSEDSIMVALMGGLDHAGVRAYMDSEMAAGEDEIKLIDGILYYDDGLREADDDYSDYLQSLKKEAITYLEWSRKQKNVPMN